MKTNDYDYDYDVALESMSPKRLKKGLTRMLIIMLEYRADDELDTEFSSDFFSDLQILFDFLGDLKKSRKYAKITEEGGK
jgi:hypothetical protein